VSDSDFKTLTSAVGWAHVLWPIAFSLVATVLVRTRVRSIPGYFTIAALACFGLNTFSSLVTWSWRFDFEPKTPSDQIALLVVSRGVTVLVLSAVLSVPVLYWLHRLMRRISGGDT
jgi:hypothetical protein